LAAPIGVAGLALASMAVHLFGQAAPPTETINLKFDVVAIKPSEAGGGRDGASALDLVADCP
jgi:hypothetical protein